MNHVPDATWRGRGARAVLSGTRVARSVRPPTTPHKTRPRTVGRPRCRRTARRRRPERAIGRRAQLDLWSAPFLHNSARRHARAQGATDELTPLKWARLGDWRTGHRKNGVRQKKQACAKQAMREARGVSNSRANSQASSYEQEQSHNNASHNKTTQLNITYKQTNTTYPTYVCNN